MVTSSVAVLLGHDVNHGGGDGPGDEREGPIDLGERLVLPSELVINRVVA